MYWNYLKGHDCRFLIGVSNGATMAAALLLRGKIPFDGAVLFRPILPSIAADTQHTHRCPVLILDGSHDTRRNPGDAAEAASALLSNGFDVTRRTSQCGHDPTGDECTMVRRWLQRPSQTGAKQTW